MQEAGRIRVPGRQRESPNLINNNEKYSECYVQRALVPKEGKAMHESTRLNHMYDISQCIDSWPVNSLARDQGLLPY